VDGASTRDLLAAAVESIAQRCAEIAAAADNGPNGARASGGAANRAAAARPAVRV
jgi:hypothetical protein